MAEQKKHMGLEEMRTALMAVDRKIRREMGVRSHKLPIYQTTTWEFFDPHQMKEAFEGRELLDYYSVLSGPNYRAFEEKLAILESLEGGVAQICASGHMAIYATLMLLSKPGQSVITHQELYGGTYHILEFLQKEGRAVHFVDMRNLDEMRHALQENTAVIFFETPSNPSLHIIDIEKIVEEAKQCERDNLFVVVDNTFATPFNQRPLNLGAHVVIESVTKYLDGHGINFGGTVIGEKSIIDRLYSLLAFAPMPPFVAWQLSDSILDFLQAMPLHNQNAWHIAHFLTHIPAVERVYYPGLPSHRNHEIASRQMVALDDGIPFGGMVSFQLIGSKKEAELFIKKLYEQKSVITHAVSLGNRDSLIQIPAFGTHAKGGNIPDNLIRLSVGIESRGRLETDISNAIAAVFPPWI